MITSNLYNKDQSIAFYEERYELGYMDEWPLEKKQRVFEVIRSLGLPATGDALDFGCGNGVFTQVLKQALPGWNVYGTDISEVAVSNARKRYPDCHFFSAQDSAQQSHRFDFLFSHHVLEHVYDSKAIFTEIDQWLKPWASMLHILPCGNAGSLERTLCEMRTDGIDETTGGRFFFEDAGHVRRLTTAQLTSLSESIGFQLAKAWYANHYYGAIDWITDYGKDFIRQLTDLSKARNEEGRVYLQTLQKQLLRVYHSKQIYKRGYRNYLQLSWRLPILSAHYLGARIIFQYYTYKAHQEWTNDSHHPHGSEMYVYYTRHA